jgi:signal transduction histidine kinase/ActR/RegA family two-component response regulator
VVVDRGVEVLSAKTGAMVRIDDGATSTAEDAACADQTLAPVIAEALRSRKAHVAGACVALPLDADGRALGAVAFRFDRDLARDDATGAVLDTIAKQGSQALDRAQSFEREVWLRSRLEMLASAAAALSGAATRNEVAAVVIERGATVMGAEACVLHMLDDAGTTLELLGSRGVEESLLDPVRTLNAASLSPVWDLVMSGEQVWGESSEELVERFPLLGKSLSRSGRARAFWFVPLVAEGRTLGVMGMAYDGERRFHAEKRTFVETFVRQCAQALLRALRLDRETASREAAEEAHAALQRDQQGRALVAETTAALATSLDYKATLTKLVGLLVPKLADWSAVEMIDENTGLSEPVAVTHADAELVGHTWEMRHRFPTAAGAPMGVPNVLRTGKSELYEEITDEMIGSRAQNEEHAAMARALKLSSAMIVPLVAREVTLGAITLAYADSGRRYTRADLALVEDIAARAAIAVDNARLFGAEQRARAAADEANRLKDEFLATVSHELRTPLNAILGWSRMMTTGLVDEGRRARALETIDRNAVAMTQLIEDLLDVSRIISGKMRLDVESLDLAKVAEAAIDSIRPAALAKEITLRAVLEPSPGPVLGDPNRMQQVVWNLLSNAVKFTPRGGRVEVVLRRAGSHAELTVTDSGAGIAPEFVPHVFDRFRQADGRLTRAHGGLGLGLAITRQLVELHGGTVRASSAGLGHGASFTVLLPVTAVRPVATDAAAALSSGSKVPREALEELRGLRLLAVDDDEDSRRLLQTVLEKAGATVTLAASVDDAMAAFEREIPDVLLSDIGMPGKDGVELIRMIRARSPERGGRVPAAALTAYARTADRTRVLSAGFLMHLPKPIEPDELLAVVSNLARFTTR